MTDLDFGLAVFRLSLAIEQGGGVVVQNGGLLGVGETELGDGAGGGQRVIDREVAAEDDPDRKSVV